MLMKNRRNEQGFFTMIVILLLILIATVTLAYLRVKSRQG
jgi:hypothetical protein